MDKTCEELERELKDAQGFIEALRNGEIDAVIGSDPSKTTMLVETKSLVEERNQLLVDLQESNRRLNKEIADRTRAERERDLLFTAINRSPVSVIVTDTRANIVYSNPACEKSTGYKANELCGSNCRIFKSDTHDDMFYQHLWETISAGEVWSGMIVNRRKDGSTYNEEMVISPILDERKTLLNYVAVKRDTSRDDLFNKVRKYFSSITSHELRTPLFKIGLACDLLQGMNEISEEKKIKVVINALSNAKEGLARIVDTSSVFSDLSSAAGKREWGLTRIDGILAQCAIETRQKMERTERNVSFNVDTGSIPSNTTIRGDRVLLCRAIQELLDNAFYFTPDNSRISLSAYAEQNEIIVIIQDEGEGIPKEKMEDVFEPYYSLENPEYHGGDSAHYMRSGMGMGLTLARMIVNLFNGQLSIENGQECGATITLRLPLERL